MTLLEDAIDVLDGYSPDDPSQQRLRSEFLAHLDAHPDGIWRDGPPAHLTASCFVFDPAGERVLLTLHRKGGFWVQLGGHLEPGDSTLAGAALREATEESGVGLALAPGPVGLHRHELSAAFGRCREHLDVAYAAVAATGAMPAVSDESDDVAWWLLDALPATVVPDLPARLAQLTSSSSAAGCSRAPLENPSRNPRARSVRG